MERELLGWPPDGPAVDLDHERFSYAGKFVMTSTGKAVGREDGVVVAAAAFSEDRTDDSTLWLRYVTVRAERRGEGLGPALVSFVGDRAAARGYDRLRIAVNNPYAYEALWRAGFGYTGRTTGIAEVVLQRPGERSTSAYRDGLEALRERAERSPDEHGFIEEKLARGPPDAG